MNVVVVARLYSSGEKRLHEQPSKQSSQRDSSQEFWLACDTPSAGPNGFLPPFLPSETPVLSRGCQGNPWAHPSQAEPHFPPLATAPVANHPGRPGRHPIHPGSCYERENQHIALQLDQDREREIRSTQKRKLTHIDVQPHPRTREILTREFISMYWMSEGRICLPTFLEPTAFAMLNSISAFSTLFPFFSHPSFYLPPKVQLTILHIAISSWSNIPLSSHIRQDTSCFRLTNRKLTRAKALWYLYPLLGS